MYWSALIVFQGFTALLVQVLLLRRLLSIFTGNELDIGITLGFWLLFTSVGAYAGARAKGRYLLPVSFIAFGLLIVPLYDMAGLLRPIMGLSPGEVFSVIDTIKLTALLLAGPCLIIGAWFSIVLGQSGLSPGRVYGLEALGACLAGGLFTLILAGRLSSQIILVAAAALSLLAGGLMLKGRARFSLLIPLALLGFWQVSPGFVYDMPVPAYSGESRYGPVTVYESSGQSSVYRLGGRLYTMPEPETSEPLSLIPITLRPNAQRVLLTGGSPETLSILLKYPALKTDVIEPDVELYRLNLSIYEKHFGALPKSHKVRFIHQDVRAWLKQAEAPLYDIIISGHPPPETALAARMFTSEFFSLAGKRLRPGGLLVIRLASAYGYLGPSGRALNSSIYAALKGVFKHTELSASQYGLLLASDKSIDILSGKHRETLRALPPDTAYINESVVIDMFNPFNVNKAVGTLDRSARPNTDRRPVAFYYMMQGWIEGHALRGRQRDALITGLIMRAFSSHHEGWLLILAASVLSLFIFAYKNRSRALGLSVFGSGAGSMALIVVVMLLYQSAFGYIYNNIALLSALFMAGAAGGSIAGRRVKKPLKAVMLIEGLWIGLALVINYAEGPELLYYALALSAGALTGAGYAFCALADISTGLQGRGGRLYGIELFGAFLGAMLTSLLVLPLYAAAGVALTVMVIKAASLAALLTVSKA